MLIKNCLILWAFISLIIKEIKAFTCPDGDPVPVTYTKASSYAPTTLFYRKESVNTVSYNTAKGDCESDSPMIQGRSTLAMFRNDQEYADMKTMRGEFPFYC